MTMITPITPEMVARINELGRKKKEGRLTEEECAEQATLRRLYIDNIKGQVKVHLDAEQEHIDSPNCSCGCHTKH
jgi:uncharacterized protein YnzC (UPF0291/DUF896 family)